MPHPRCGRLGGGAQAVRLARERPREVARTRAKHCVAARAATLGQPRHVGLGLVRAQLATLGLQKTQVARDAPRILSVAGVRLRLIAPDARRA